MANGYTRASEEVIPAARVVIARALKEKYGMSESRIAQTLGVAQAAVSKYLNKKCSVSVERLCNSISSSDLSPYLADISKGDKARLKACICSLCGTLNKFDCKFSALNKGAN